MKNYEYAALPYIPHWQCRLEERPIQATAEVCKPKQHNVINIHRVGTEIIAKMQQCTAPILQVCIYTYYAIFIRSISSLVYNTQL